jgi:hypothetical protein
MPRNKIQNSKFKIQNQNLKLKISLILNFTLWFYILHFTFYILCFAQEQFVYDAKGKRDPFIPLVTPEGRLLKLEREEGAAELLLEGIIYDKYGLSYAIVNGEVVRIGDKISDYQVLKIEENKVIFIKGGQPMEIELEKGEE